MNNDTKFCKFCGEKIAVDAIICPKCGRQVEAVIEQRQPIFEQNFSFPKKEKPIVVKNSVTCKPKTVVKVKGRKHSLIFDLIMLCLTGGLWLIWMIIRTIFGY